MIRIPETLPVPKHHTMSVVDSSKIQAFQDCPRGFFFNYVLGLRRDAPQIHLDFGSAWHDAMETLLLVGNYEDAVPIAYERFLKRYREAFPDPVTDFDKAPKNPEYAHKALEMYAKQYKSDNFEVLYTETAGLVPVSEERDLVVKLDSIVRDLNRGEVNSMEHKTTGRNSASWRDKWHIMLQVESYTHLLYSLFPEDEVGKIIINGSVFTKSKTWEGVRIPVYKSPRHMANFLWLVNHWIDQIEWNYQQLSKASVDDPMLKAFPINCSSCSKYGCRMGGLCSAFPNPLKFAEDPPTGYKVDFWDPLRGNLAKADNVVEAGEDGKVKIREKTQEEAKEYAEPEPEQEDEDFSAFLPPDRA